MKLYYHPLSTYSRRVLIWMLEKEVDIPTHEVDMPDREHRSEWYKAFNPYGRVPTLVDKGFVLYESTAILEYLDNRHPEPPLVPSTLEEKAHVWMHMKLCDIELASHAGTMIFPKRFLPQDKWRRDEMDRAKKYIDRHVAILDEQLDGEDYLVGGRFTLADLVYIPFIAFWDMLEVDPPRNVAAWTERVLTRASVEQTKPAM